MPRFWLDSNVLIEAHNRSYPIGRAKTFWSMLDKQIQAGNVLCPRRVYQEVAEHEYHQDAIAGWMQARKKMGLCVPPTQRVCDLVGEIEAYIWANPQFDQSHNWQFCKGADPWVIAQAACFDDTVVTHESSLHPKATKPLVPDICKEFGVPFVNLLGMIEILDLEF